MTITRYLLLILLLQRGLGACAQFSLPLKQLYLTSGFGCRFHPVTGKPDFHAGVDFRGHHDTILAIADGVVAEVGYQRFLGIYIKLDHHGLQCIYGHLSRIWVLPGDTVVSGQFIGISGASGRVTGGHLHFAVLFRNRPVDPVKFLYHLLKYNNHE